LEDPDLIETARIRKTQKAKMEMGVRKKTKSRGGGKGGKAVKVRERACRGDRLPSLPANGDDTGKHTFFLYVWNFFVSGKVS
jgi:hypothetical protein